MCQVTAKITVLIDKQDNMEIIRDEIAAILAVEIANQKVLAVAAGQDASDYDFNIYTEKSSPWELVENSEGEISSQVPLINIYIESANLNTSKASDVTSVVYSVKYNIDCISAKNSKITGGSKFSGDELASYDSQRVCRLVRNILQSSQYKYLNLPTIMMDRKLSSITMFQPQISERAAQHCVGARIVFQVDVIEYSPEYDAPILDTVFGSCTRGDDGKILFDVEFDELADT